MVSLKSLYNKKNTIRLENIKSLSVHYKKLVNPSLLRIEISVRIKIHRNRLEINVAFPFFIAGI
jgi:hypothetical protein